MLAPIDNNTYALASQFSYLAARQRVEKVLEQLTVEPGAEESSSEAGTISGENLLNAIQQVNDVLRTYGVYFEKSEDSGRVIIQLIDRESGELIRQIPPEEALNAAQRLEEIKGRLLNLAV